MASAVSCFISVLGACQRAQELISLHHGLIRTLYGCGVSSSCCDNIPDRRDLRRRVYLWSQFRRVTVHRAGEGMVAFITTGAFGRDISTSWRNRKQSAGLELGGKRCNLQRPTLGDLLPITRLHLLKATQTPR